MMTFEELKLLREFRAKYPDLHWDDLGRLFGVTGVEAREHWLVSTERPRPCPWRPFAPAWWRAARDLAADGYSQRQIAHMLGRHHKSVSYALSEMRKAA